MRCRGGKNPERNRAGLTLIELASTSLMLVAAMGILVTVLGWMAAENRGIGRRRAAETEAANVMERISLEPWDRLSARELKRVTLSPEAKRALPDGELAIDVKEDASSLKRIHIEVRWRDRSGTTTAPVRLTTWIARRPGDSP
jgi:hypothetical protein